MRYSLRGAPTRRDLQSNSAMRYATGRGIASSVCDPSRLLHAADEASGAHNSAARSVTGQRRALWEFLLFHDSAMRSVAPRPAAIWDQTAPRAL